jgi:signal peptidase I
MARKKREKAPRPEAETPTVPEPEESGGEEGKEGERPDSLVEWAKSIAIAVVLFLVLRSFIVQTFIITSGSMEETLLVGDMLVVNRLAMGSPIPGTGLRIPGYSSPEYGDVLVFDPPHDDTLKLIKRLVGMGGDTLEMRSRVLYRNGSAVPEPYVTHHNVPDERDYTMDWQQGYLLSDADPEVYSPSRDTWGPLVIPAEHYFMLGDNREMSYDSRYWGLLERWRLEGRAVFIYYAYNGESYRPFPWLREVRWGRIGDRIR